MAVDQSSSQKLVQISTKCTQLLAQRQPVHVGEGHRQPTMNAKCELHSCGLLQQTVMCCLVTYVAVVVTCKAAVALLGRASVLDITPSALRPAARCVLNLWLRWLAVEVCFLCLHTLCIDWQCVDA
jgi:hypothetical protein